MMSNVAPELTGMTTQTLLVFVKNPVPGTVKTRIARTVGNDTATAVYRHLLAYTQQVVEDFVMGLAHPNAIAVVVYYGDFVQYDDGWNGFYKLLQTGNPALANDLGHRMLTAFDEQFAAGAGRVVIIGSDCLDLSPDHLHRAFAVLDTADVVIGPATDGGYYLLGMSRLHPFLFADDLPWSQPDLRQRTETIIQENGLTLALLDELTDIDEWADYARHPARQTNAWL
jgi:uncharacterized protein